MHYLRWTAVILITTGLGWSQAFEAASVKPAAPGSRAISGGPASKDPGRIHYSNVSLKNLLMIAYDMKNFQISGPDWLDTERFDIAATMPPGTSQAQFHLMLQRLVMERFKMTVHRETKELPMYALGVAKGGPKLTESKIVVPPESADEGSPLPGPVRMERNALPDVPPSAVGRPGIFNFMTPARYRMIGQQQTMQNLATMLSTQLNRPVTDATGLTGKYDFTVTFLPEQGMLGPYGPLPPPPPDADGGRGPMPIQADPTAAPDIFHALQSQLGLKLDAKKGPVESIVIDHIEKTPIEN